MPAPELNPDLTDEASEEAAESTVYGTTIRGNHATFGDARSAGNHHIDKSCVVRQNIYCAKAIEAAAFQVNTSSYGDPEDPQFDPEHVYDSNIVAGFVKNDAAGNFLFGQAGGGTGATALDNLTDVTLTAPVAREYLCFDSASSMWVNQVIAFNDLGDVVLVAPTDGQHLIFDAGTSTWINKNANSLDDLDDVVLTSPANGQFLRFDGSDWVNAVISASDLPTHTHVEADITDLQNYALVVHTHVEADITDLQAYLLNINSESLGDLSNVSVATPNSGDHLEFDGLNWIAAAPGHTAPGATSLDDLSDVTITTPATDSVLQFDGAVWIDRPDVELSSTSAYYLGDPNTNGTWRFVRSGSDLQVELRELGVYNSKGSFTP